MHLIVPDIALMVKLGLGWHTIHHLDIYLTITRQNGEVVMHWIDLTHGGKLCPVSPATFFQEYAMITLVV
uniref:Putative secreted protein n=1 Tax=Anopheles marajoara TaxID=58244 RepID=A0A2M4CEI9_9DIPT